MDGVILRLAGHWAGAGAVSPLALAPDVVTPVVSLGGAPGLAVISVHQDTRLILHILKYIKFICRRILTLFDLVSPYFVSEGKDTVGACFAAPGRDT